MDRWIAPGCGPMGLELPSCVLCAPPSLPCPPLPTPSSSAGLEQPRYTLVTSLLLGGEGEEVVQDETVDLESCLPSGTTRSTKVEIMMEEGDGTEEERMEEV